MAGCTRHRTSEDPPIHLNPNMDIQPRYNPQAESEFFEDGATMRPLVPGTVARGYLGDDIGLVTGRNRAGEYIENPAVIDMRLLKRGRERYDIFCSPCHSRAGDGKGIMIQRGYLPPPSFYDARLLEVADGYIFEVISNGIRNMPKYRYQIPVEDRWAIVAYVRALQRSQTATLDDIPEDVQESLK